MPQAFLCAGSVRTSEIAINETHGAATLGTAAHEALRPLAERGGVDWDGLPALAERFNVSLPELRMLCAQATKLWPSIADSFAGAMTEVALSAEVTPEVRLTGHIDLMRSGGRVARVGDWKTGRKDSDYSQQMRAYGALALLENPDLTEVTVTVIWVRDGDIENYTMRRSDLQDWIEQLVDTVVNWNGVYRAGAHCGHCARNHECPAANALVRRDVAAIADTDLLGRAENELVAMTDSEKVDLYRKADIVARYADRVKQAIKSHVQAHGDVVADGVRITIDTEERRDIDTAAAWPLLESSGFDDDDFANCVEIRISKVEKTVATKAGKGNGAAAVRALKKALQDSGAVSIREIQKLTTKRA